MICYSAATFSLVFLNFNIEGNPPSPTALEIKVELDTEKASQAAIIIAATYRLCRVSVDTGYLQLAVANAIAIIIIRPPRPAPTIKKSSYTRTTMTEACYTV
jgi:hypothetical protein